MIEGVPLKKQKLVQNRVEKNSAKIFMKQEIINKLPPDARKEFLKYAIKLSEKKKQGKVNNDFLSFVKHVWPEFIEGKHHKEIADKFNKLASGEIKRLIINMPPRHTKSEFASYLLPSWMVGRKPDLKIIQTTHTTELAIRFGRKAKTLIDSPEYQQIFKTRLREDSQAAGKWETEQGGEYYAAGVGSAITGRGADLLIIDDPHSEQDAMNQQALERAYDWYTSGPRQRLKPGGSILLVMTRWAEDDLTGRLLRAQTEPKADSWRQISFPAILPSGNPVWPEYWNLEELETIKSSVPIRNWSAQYMQEPTSDEGAIIKREWWMPWKRDGVPALKHVIQSYDTAFSKKETADYSAITTWGVFFPEEGGGPQIILLDAFRVKFDFPELKAVALEHYRYWEPESVIIEQKASGEPLTQEFRRAGIPVIPFVPSKGNDKHTRVNSVAPIFESGQVWFPYGEKFADDVIEECAAFPHGANDDYVDSTTQAVLRYRQGNFIELYSDYKDETDLPPKEYRYY